MKEISDLLIDVEILFETGKFSLITDRITQFEEINKIRYKSDAKSSLELLDPKQNTQKKEILKLLAWKMKTSFQLGLFNESMEMARVIFKESRKLDFPLLEVESLVIQGLIAFILHKIKIPQILKKARILDSQSYNQPTIMLYEAKMNMLKIYSLLITTLPDYDQALNLAKKCAQSCRTYGNTFDLALSLAILSMCHFFVGNFMKSITAAQESVKLHGGDNNLLKINLFNTLGVCNNHLGNLDLALEYEFKCITICREFQRNYHTYFINIAEIYLAQGEINLTLDTLLKNPPPIHKSGIDMVKADYYKLTMIVAIELSRQDIIDQCILDLENIAQQSNNEVTLNIYHYCQAYLLKNSMKARDRVHAEEMLRILLKKKLDPPLYYDSSLLLNEFLLKELRITNDSDLIDEIKELIQKLEKSAIYQHANNYLPKIYLLKAKFEFFLLNYEKSRKYFIKAQNFADQFHMRNIAIQISQEFDKFVELEEKLKDIQKETPEISFSKRLDLIELESAFRKFNPKPNPEETNISEEPMLLTIMLKSGTTVFSKPFNDSWTFNEQLFGGFLTAFSTFSNEIFAESLDRAKFGSYMILMAPIKRFVICYVIKGGSYFAQKKLHEFKDNLFTNTSLWLRIEEAANHSEVIQETKIPLLMDLINGIFLQKSGKDYIELPIFEEKD
jgi:tetratricopeptide (TPR) repeat protein